MGRTRVMLFKPSGKYYTEEEWEIPPSAIGPYDMAKSPSWRRISGGPVLITSDEWGYPHLFPEDRSPVATWDGATTRAQEVL